MKTRVVVLTSLLAAFAAPAALAQQQSGATVTAVVHDSLAGGPLAEAMVQLVSATDPMAFSRAGETDSRGRVTFRDIPAGRYAVGFMHATLDALGVAAPTREIQVAETGPHRVDLAIPSARRLRAAMCGPQPQADSTAFVVGTVRDPRDGTPMGDASVSARWMELSIGTAGIRQQTAGAATTTGSNGWFVLCGLPSGTVMLAGGRAGESTDTLELQLTVDALVRRDLYVATAGHTELRGRVVSADSAKPLPGVEVAVVGGPKTTTDATGAWKLENVPFGTRMIEVRALGFYPERRPVDVVVDAPPVELTLQTFQAVLDAVRVTASRLPGEAGLSGFAERRRGSGMGRFLDPVQIARRNPVFTSDLLRTMPGFVGDGSLTMKSNFSDGLGGFDTNCTAEVYVDGQLLRGITSGELDGLVSPENIVGMEVYSAGSPKPAQFDSGLSGCGALVIWQKPMNERVRRRR